MDQNAMLHMKVEKDGFEYTFMMPIGAPLGASYDAVFQMLQHIVTMSNEVADKMKRPEGDDPLASDSKPDESGTD